jgi:hypothetical protein
VATLLVYPLSLTFHLQPILAGPRYSSSARIAQKTPFLCCVVTIMSCLLCRNLVTALSSIIMTKIKIDESADWIDLAQDRIRWRDIG